MTLIEVTLVLSVLLSILSVAMIGVQAYKRGTDRSRCIQSIAYVQKAMRSYSNFNGLGPGDTVPDLKEEIIGPGKLVPTEPRCTASGIYTFGGDIISPQGVAYMTCSVPDHAPKTTAGW